MKISSQEEYGLRCLLRLARGDEQSSLTIPEIAHAEGLSAPYVAKLLAVLLVVVCRVVIDLAKEVDRCVWS